MRGPDTLDQRAGPGDPKGADAGVRPPELHDHRHSHAGHHPHEPHVHHGHPAAHHHAPAVTPFGEAELQRLHHEDLGAATAVVSLMVGIFLVGVVLYSIVAWVVSTLPPR